MRTQICDIIPPVGPRGGYCRWCGQLVRADSFRDSVSGREYLITALCQGCQDEMYLGGSKDGPPASGPVHRGAVFAAVPERGMPREVALLPFAFSARLGRIAWEPRDIVRAGAEPIAATSASAELRGIRDAWRGSHERVLSLGSLADPLLAARIAAPALVIVLDRKSLANAAALCSSAILPPLVDLSTAVPWDSAFGTPLLPLEPFVAACGLDVDAARQGGLRGSALRQAAFIAQLLTLRARARRRAGHTVFELLLFGQADRFEPPRKGEASDEA